MKLNSLASILCSGLVALGCNSSASTEDQAIGTTENAISVGACMRDECAGLQGADADLCKAQCQEKSRAKPCMQDNCVAELQECHDNVGACRERCKLALDVSQCLKDDCSVILDSCKEDMNACRHQCHESQKASGRSPGACIQLECKPILDQCHVSFGTCKDECKTADDRQSCVKEKCLKALDACRDTIESCKRGCSGPQDAPDAGASEDSAPPR